MGSGNVVGVKHSLFRSVRCEGSVDVGEVEGETFMRWPGCLVVFGVKHIVANDIAKAGR